MILIHHAEGRSVLKTMYPHNSIGSLLDTDLNNHIKFKTVTPGLMLHVCMFVFEVSQRG